MQGSENLGAAIDNAGAQTVGQNAVGEAAKSANSMGNVVSFNWSSLMPSWQQVAMGTVSALGAAYVYSNILPKVQKAYELVSEKLDKSKKLDKIYDRLDNENAVWNWGLDSENLDNIPMNIAEIRRNLETEIKGGLPIYYTFATYGNAGDILKVLLDDLSSILPEKSEKRRFIAEKRHIRDVIAKCIFAKTGVDESDLSQVNENDMKMAEIRECLIDEFKDKEDKRAANAYFRIIRLQKRMALLKNASLELLDQAPRSVNA